MFKVKNVQSGILIIADAGIKLGPGETADIGVMTPQMESAIDGGLLARVDIEPEVKQRSRTVAKAEELKLESQPASEPAKTDPGAKNGAG